MAVCLSLFVLLTLSLHNPLIGAIDLTGPGQISLPKLTVAAAPTTLYSGDYTLELKNPSENNGWLLTGEILQGVLEGANSGETIPAEFTFKSITWIEGGQGSTVGITVHTDGKRIEADPGFGRGTYSIQFEIQFTVPAFPRTDSYYGVSSFSIQ